MDPYLNDILRKSVVSIFVILHVYTWRWSARPKHVVFAICYNKQINSLVHSMKSQHNGQNITCCATVLKPWLYIYVQQGTKYNNCVSETYPIFGNTLVSSEYLKCTTFRKMGPLPSWGAYGVNGPTQLGCLKKLVSTIVRRMNDLINNLCYKTIRDSLLCSTLATILCVFRCIELLILWSTVNEVIAIWSEVQLMGVGSVRFDFIDYYSWCDYSRDNDGTYIVTEAGVPTSLSDNFPSPDVTKLHNQMHPWCSSKLSVEFATDNSDCAVCSRRLKRGTIL
jgi:hypothetical protein